MFWAKSHSTVQHLTIAPPAPQYVHALRARGLESKVVIFPEDTHALDK
jgi:hypothetical protein